MRIGWNSEGGIEDCQQRQQVEKALHFWERWMVAGRLAVVQMEVWIVEECCSRKKKSYL